MDNLVIHKNKATLSLLEEGGVEVLFLLPYSPDLNPIQMMWSKIKSLLRKAEARTQEACHYRNGTVQSHSEESCKLVRTL